MLWRSICDLLPNLDLLTDRCLPILDHLLDHIGGSPGPASFSTFKWFLLFQLVQMFPVYYIFNFLMTLLLVLHVFWYYLITLIAYRVCSPFHFILQAFKIVSNPPLQRYEIKKIKTKCKTLNSGNLCRSFDWWLKKWFRRECNWKQLKWRRGGREWLKKKEFLVAVLTLQSLISQYFTKWIYVLFCWFRQELFSFWWCAIFSVCNSVLIPPLWITTTSPKQNLIKPTKMQMVQHRYSAERSYFRVTEQLPKMCQPNF